MTSCTKEANAVIKLSLFIFNTQFVNSVTSLCDYCETDVQS